jgi:ATP-dependent RNA helicase DDX10/DBP4
MPTFLLDSSSYASCSTQILVLDEADRVLDMGFAPTLDAILDNLPREGRQTLLFSATQTKSVKVWAHE